MTQEEYSEKMNQANQIGQSGSQKMGYTNSYTEPSLYENTPTSESPLAYLEMGTGFIIGLAVGFFIKKSFKAVLFILGFALIVTFYMESQGIFTINQEVLEQNIAAGSEYMEYLVSALQERVTSFQSGIGAGAGFLVGLKIG
ncbi:MAG: Unknown protein [uncultured Sulfurovum sp.]|uniref:FUN14 family protein n=1 Tax=uncultured Sulfurovum sp. TaxID=269237 RepID=A0A6S6SEM8_9BACT|nr:MAG: Unknown protein [uncultured Sulfurovum sp.]